MSTTLAVADSAKRPAPRLSGPIVVSVGEQSSHVLRAAAAIAPVASERVHVFSAIEPLPAEAAAGDVGAMAPDLREVRRASRLEQLSARLAEVRAEVRAEHRWLLEVEHGEPADALLQRTREVAAALLLIGMGRQRPLDGPVGDEMALRVVGRASCPVLAVGAQLDHRPREVVIATDFSIPSMNAARAVLPLLDRGATLHVMHVWQRSPVTDPAISKVEEVYARSLTARLVRFVADLRTPPGVSVRTAVSEGPCASQIISYARRHNADLIVAARRGLNPIERGLVGSVTTSLLRGASCSVLVVPEHQYDPLPSAP
jgi:nucleotide-binding universal stress UspA family protein